MELLQEEFPFTACSGLDGSPQKRYVHLETVDVNLLEKRIFTDVIKWRVLRWDCPGLLRWALNPMTSVIRERQRDTDTETRRRWGEDGGRDWRDAATSQGTPEATRSRKRQEGFSPGGFGGNMAPSTPWFQIYSFQNYEKNNFCSFKPCSLWSFAIAATGNKNNQLWDYCTLKYNLDRKGRTNTWVSPSICRFTE